VVNLIQIGDLVNYEAQMQ